MKKEILTNQKANESETAKLRALNCELEHKVSMQAPVITASVVCLALTVTHYVLWPLLSMVIF
jgi:hypothetical protein